MDGGDGLDRNIPIRGYVRKPFPAFFADIDAIHQVRSLVPDLELFMAYGASGVTPTGS